MRIGISAGAVILALLMLLLAGCTAAEPTSRHESPSESVVATETPFVGHAGPMPPWWERAPAVTHAEALAKIDDRLALPDTSTVGTIVRVSAGRARKSDEGTRGALILYSSGVELLVNRGESRLDVMTEFAPFTDRRETADELQEVDGIPVLVTEPGLQVSSHGDNRLPAMLIWNAGGMRYVLRSSEENQSTEFLKRVMHTMQSRG